MQILSDFLNDCSHHKPDTGSYEWWYFDAISVNGQYSLVVIFYEGNPFSRRYIDALEKKTESNANDYPAISISVYKNGDPVFYSFEEVEPGAAKFSDIRAEGRVGNNRFVGEITEDRNLRYHLHLSQEVPNGDHLRADLIFLSSMPSDFGQERGTAVKHRHTWNLIQPKADVSGEIIISGFKEETIRFEGSGYHDHNLGLEPMKESFEDWYWGRFHLNGYTLVYYLMNENGSMKNRAWLFSPDEEVREVHGKLTLTDYGLNVFGLKSARKIELKNKSTELLIQQQSLLDDGPFYQRFSSRLMLHLDGVLLQGTGISEYIHPERIHSKLFRPLVNMRIRYPGKAHWVQKSPHLYRWTW